MATLSSLTSHGSRVWGPFANSTCVGELNLVDNDSNNVLATRKLYMGHDLSVGRNKNNQWVLQDAYLSGVHLRIYTIAYTSDADEDEDGRTEYLVYAEDLSRNGTFWNGSLIGKGNGGFLLSHEDKLRLSSQTSFCFKAHTTQPTTDHFDLRQEREMARFRREYVVTDRLLGSGAFGRVYMSIEQHQRSQVACKVISLDKFRQARSRHFSAVSKPSQVDTNDRSLRLEVASTRTKRQGEQSRLLKQIKTCQQEADILSQLSHPNIIGLHKVYITNDTIYMFQDLVTAGDLFSYIESKNGSLSEVEAAVIIRQILVALEFLHGQEIVHRDLKPENILMTSLSTGCRIVLTDFGTARRVKSSQRMYSVIGSEHYAAPEVQTVTSRHSSTQVGYTKSVDMWSVGTISVVLLTGGSAFEDPSTGTYSPLLARTCNLRYLQQSREWQQIRPRPQDFVTKLLVLDEQGRMTAQQALEHCWFSNEIHRVDFEELYQRTIRSWHPRAAKLPVIEYMRSSFAREFAPTSSRHTARRGTRQEMKSVDPHYKPFPRNMHLPLWPKRVSTDQNMSNEVKMAIAKAWTARSEIAPLSLNPSTFPRQQDTEKRRDQMQGAIRGQAQSLATTGSQMTKSSCFSLLPTQVRQILPTTATQEGLAPPMQLMPTPEAITDWESMQTLPNASSAALETSLILKDNAAILLTRPSSGLRRRSMSHTSALQAKKRRCNTMFDLPDGKTSDEGDTTGHQMHTVSKKSKTSYAEDAIVLAHNARIMLAPECAEEKQSLYLPRV